MLSKSNKFRMFIKGTPASAIVSLIMGVISVVILIVSGVLSCTNQGEAGMIIGILGVAAMILNVVGFAIASKSAKGEEIVYALPIFSIILNGVMFIIYLSFYIFGFLLTI